MARTVVSGRLSEIAEPKARIRCRRFPCNPYSFPLILCETAHLVRYLSNCTPLGLH